MSKSSKGPNYQTRNDDLATEALAFAYGAELEESVDAPPPPPPAREPSPPAEQGWLPALNPTQELIFNDGSENVLGYGEKGCRTGDTIVYTGTGLVRLADLQPAGAEAGKFSAINQDVISFDGTKRVQAVAGGFWVEESNDALMVELANGAEITGSHRHPLWVCWQSDKGYGFGFKSFAEMGEGRAALIRYWTPLMEHRELRNDGPYEKVCGFEITPSLSYAIGALVGDGSLNVLTGDHRSVGFTNMDEECLAGVRDGLGTVGCKLGYNCRYQYLVRGPRLRIRSIIRELGIGCLSYHKRIPAQIIRSPKPVVTAFLRGLFDTDGTVEKMGLVSLCTTSEGLGRDVQDLLAALGMLCVRRPKKSASGNPTWTLSLMGSHAHRFGKQIGFNIARKQDRISKPKMSPLNPHGFNHNLYGFPKPISEVMRQVAFASRDGKRKRAWHNQFRHLHSFGSVPARSKVEAFCNLYNCHKAVEPFLISDNWLEVKSVTPAKAQLFDLHVSGTHSFLASGTINHNSGKSIGFGHKIVRHCYEEDNALYLVIAPTMRTANEGIWHDLDTLVLPAWRDGNRDKQGNLLDSGIGLEYTVSKLDPNTKDRHRWVRNRHGGWSKLLLMSIPYSAQVAQRVKGPAPSGVYIDELTECESVEYWTYTSAQLGRRRGIEGPQQFGASCNPQGPSHWVYKLFWIDHVDAETGARDPDFSVHHVPIKENLKWLPEGYIERLERTFKNDPIERERLIEGKWVDRPTGEGLFKEYFAPSLHLKGDRRTGQGLMPKPGFPMIIGYDLGQVFSSITFEQCIPTKSGKNIWFAFDEIDHLGEKILYKNLALEVIEKIRYWNKVMDYTFRAMHIADDSAVNQWRPQGEGSYDAWEFEKEFNKVSDRPVKMIGCPKGSGSKPARVRLLQGKLYGDEFFCSALCKNTHEMLMQLESDPQDPEVPKRGKWIHKFDSVTYPMFRMELGHVKNSLHMSAKAPSIIRCGS